MKYQVEKSIVIDAPLSRVRPLVEDFHNWYFWSPWTVCEPDCPIEIQGHAGEQGASMQWNGKMIGSGKNTIRYADEHGIYYDLEFFKPWKSKAKTSFLFEELGDQTKVTWTMNARMPIVFFFMIASMKNWIGMDYERGLRMFKAVAETGSVSACTSSNGVMDYQGFSYVGIKRVVPT